MAPGSESTQQSSPPAKGKHGGARFGAGRPRKEELDYQASMRTLLQSRVTPEDWTVIVDSAVAWAKAGKAEARDWLTSWVMGPVPKETTINVASDGDAGVKALLGAATDEELAVLERLLARVGAE